MSKIVQEALDKAEKSNDYFKEVYDKASADLSFLSDEPYAQWDTKDAEARRRAGKPTLQIDQLSQFVSQVSNDVRMNTPSINIIATDGGDPETAEIIEGKIREIERNSNADDAYDNAVNFSIKSSIGYIRVDHDYANNDSFDQELMIKRVVNPSSILFDPDSVEADGRDAKFCVILENLTKDEFKDRYPDNDPVSFDIEGTVQDDSIGKDITIAEYFVIDESPIYIFVDEFGELQKSETKPEYAQKVRKTTSKKILRYKVSGQDVLEEGTFPGDYIPVVPVLGEEAWIDGKRHLYSLIRRAKDPQRLYNYWASVETEILMKAPKSPVVAVEGTVEDYAEDWQNPEKAAVLRYTQTDSAGRPAAAPQFTPPIQIPAGIVNARQQTTGDIRSTMGLYDSFLGQQDNAISGVAIGSRQKEGDRAVFHFADNLVRSITQVGRIIVSAMPEIYDQPRVVQIIGKEDTEDKVGVNGMVVEGQERHYDLTQGNYSVSVTTGASYATMRQEATSFFERVVASQPQLMSIAGDLLFKYADFPGAQALSERLKKTIDPKILDDELDPQMMAMQKQNEQMQQGIQMLEGQIGQLVQQLQDKQAEIEIKAKSEMNDSAEAKLKHQLDVAKLRLDEQKTAGELALKKQELELRAFEVGLKTSEKATEQRNQALQGVGQFRQDINGGLYD